MERSGGVAAIVCDTTGNTVWEGYCYTCLAIGGVFRSGHYAYLRRLRSSRFLPIKVTCDCECDGLVHSGPHLGAGNAKRGGSRAQRRHQGPHTKTHIP